MNEITVWLNEPNAYPTYPFVHQIGERVRSNIDGREGIVKNAKFLGAGHPGGAFSITYQVQLDDEAIIEVPMIELEKV
jgi:hypothetical protein